MTIANANDVVPARRRARRVLIAAALAGLSGCTALDASKEEPSKDVFYGKPSKTPPTDAMVLVPEKHGAAASADGSGERRWWEWFKPKPKSTTEAPRAAAAHAAPNRASEAPKEKMPEKAPLAAAEKPPPEPKAAETPKSRDKPSGLAKLFAKEEADDDVWSIRCIAIPGPDRFRYIKRYEDLLKNVAGLKPQLVQVIHGNEESTLYYGRYRRRYDPSAGKATFEPNHLKDMQLIQQLSFQDQNVWPFRVASLETLPSTGGEAERPEWDLARQDATWSLHVAVFYNTKDMTQRKQAAVEYCKLLRDSGEQAFYHHGTTNSSVCVGLFPKSAIAEVRETDPLSGVLRVKNKIVDPRLLALQKKYPNSIENGHTMLDVVSDPQTGKKEKLPIASFPVEVPRSERRTTNSLGG